MKAVHDTVVSRKRAAPSNDDDGDDDVQPSDSSAGTSSSAGSSSAAGSSDEGAHDRHLLLGLLIKAGTDCPASGPPVEVKHSGGWTVARQGKQQNSIRRRERANR